MQAEDIKREVARCKSKYQDCDAEKCVSAGYPCFQEADGDQS